MGVFNKQAPGDNPGYVYLLRRGPFHKIGHANSVYWRMKTIGHVRTPPEARQYPAEVLWSLKCDDQITTERSLHQRLAAYHMDGEWFAFPEDIVNWICQQSEESACEEYNPTLYRRTDSSRYRS